MADQEVHELTSEAQPLPDDLHLVSQIETAGQRVKRNDAAATGYTEIESITVTSANPTVTLGHFHLLTIAGLTANRIFELPSSSEIGKCVDVFVSDGSGDYGIIIQGAAGVTINNGAAATEYTRLFNANEHMQFRLIATDTYICTVDGRVPCLTVISTSYDQTLSTAQTVYDLTTANGGLVRVDNCSAEDQANNAIKVRRVAAVGHRFSVVGIGASAFNAGEGLSLSGRINGTAIEEDGLGQHAPLYMPSSGETSRSQIHGYSKDIWSVGDLFTMYVSRNAGSANITAGAISLEEMLQ